MHEAINHAKLAMLFRKEFELCNVRKGETIVLLSDLGARRDYVSAAFATAEDFGADAYEMCVNASRPSGAAKARSRRSRRPTCWCAFTSPCSRAGSSRRARRARAFS